MGRKIGEEHADRRCNQYRLKAKLTLRALAEVAGVSPPTIGRIFNGQATCPLPVATKLVSFAAAHPAPDGTTLSYSDLLGEAQGDAA